MKKIVFIVLLLVFGCVNKEVKVYEEINNVDNHNIVQINEDTYYYSNEILYHSNDLSDLKKDILMEGVKLSNLQVHDDKLFFILENDEKSQIYFLNNNSIELFEISLDDGIQLSDYVSVKQFIFRMDDLIILNEDTIFKINLKNQGNALIEVDHVKNIHGFNSNYIVYSLNNNDIIKADLIKGINMFVTNTGEMGDETCYLINHTLIMNRYFDDKYNGVYEFNLDNDKNSKMSGGRILDIKASDEKIYVLMEELDRVLLFNTDYSLHLFEQSHYNQNLDVNSKLVYLDGLYILNDDKLFKVE